MAIQTNLRIILGMPPNADSGIDKSDLRRIECVDCKHSDKFGKDHPCNICWNPIGDMFESKVQVQVQVQKQKTFIPCKYCQGSGEVEASEEDLRSP